MTPSTTVEYRGTDTSQLSMSTNMMRAMKRTPGSEIWVEDYAQVWALAEVVSQDNTLLTVRRTGSAEMESIDLVFRITKYTQALSLLIDVARIFSRGFGETYLHNPKIVSDMTALHHIHEAGILYNLGQRAALDNQRPYTFMGTILIAVNPLRRVPDPPTEAFVNQPLDPEMPHPFAIAELAYHQMRLGAGRAGTNQSIVVSGESGAGKTETSKIILKFLTHRSAAGVTTLDQKILETSPILESFGNAKTIRNNNSSRFGKFLKLRFTRDRYRLAGGSIETYLLEKSRVLSQGQGERNFHIFYELLAGASTTGLTEELKLGRPEAYRILSASGCSKLKGVNDEANFREVRRACETIGMEKDTQNQAWKVLAAVLHMSNIVFNAVDHEQGEVAAVKDIAALGFLGSLLGVGGGVVDAMLTQRVVTTRGENFTKQLGVQDAERTRDAIAKALFEALFLWIVRIINQSLGEGGESLPFIGVLDIFGFEDFDERNGLEQLLINFTNESLQDAFNVHIFENELRLYEQEGIVVTVSACPDNTECLKLLSEKPNGVIPSLNNICSDPKPLDSRYLEGLHKTYARHEHFPRTRPKDMHYAGSVKYTVDGWVEKNMDTIPKVFETALRSSEHKLVREMVKGSPPANLSPVRRTGRDRSRGVASLVKPTVAKTFMASMDELTATLQGTNCSFVRCIKPNAQMQCGLFENRYVVDQLQCLGVLQTCEVLRVGMPTRVTYGELKEVLGDQTSEAEELFKDEPVTSLISSILWAFEVPSEAFRLGRTRVFFKAGEIAIVQKILNDTGPEKAPWILARLKEALRNRQRAKEVAAEAQRTMGEAESALQVAEEVAAVVLGPPSDSDDDEFLVEKPVLTSSVSGTSDDDLRSLESVMKRVRSVSSTMPQIEAMINAAKQDHLGTYAKGAMDRVLDASRDAMNDIQEANDRVAALEAGIAEGKGGDEAAALKNLGTLLRRMRTDARIARELTQKTKEAAAKCQVDLAQDLGVEATHRALDVKSHALAAKEAAEGAGQISNRQQVALSKAKLVAEDARAAGEKARHAFSAFKKVLEQATCDEEEARLAAMEAAERAEREERERKKREIVSAEGAMVMAAAEKVRTASERARGEDRRMINKAVIAANVADASFAAEGAVEEEKVQEAVTKRKEEELLVVTAPSEPPTDRKASAASWRASTSVRDFLSSDRAKTPVPSPTPECSPAPPALFHGNVSMAEGPPVPHITLGRNSTEAFKATMEDCRMEGHVMMQGKIMKRWAPRYLVAENGFLRYYDKKSLVGTKKHKAMKLTSRSMVSVTDQRSFFGVRSGSFATEPEDGIRIVLGMFGSRRGPQMEWIVLARNPEAMQEWINAINAQINALFIREYMVPEDDYWGRGTTVQSFYQMDADAKPQWVVAYPEVDSPRTGDGLFGGEIIEVLQVLTNRHVTYLRMANERGWAAFNVLGKKARTLFRQIGGDLVKDRGEYTLAPTVKVPAPILFGPGSESQEMGKSIFPGEKVKAVQRFTLVQGHRSYVKLAGYGGWLPVMQGDDGNTGVIPVLER